MKNRKPTISDDPMYLLVRNEKIDEFNSRRLKGEECNFSGLDFRGLDMRGLDLDNINFSNSYFRMANLGGIDMRTCNLEGASILNANISGTYFPIELHPEEIKLSEEHGTCMRYCSYYRKLGS